MPTLRERWYSLQGQRETYAKQLGEKKQQLADKLAEMDRVVTAQLVIQEVARKTQEELRFRIESIVTMALEAVFSDPYQFVIEFEVKRNQTEARCVFERDGERVDPMTATGGGAVDIAAFALRVTLWSLRRPRPRATLLLDEPFRFVSRDLQLRAGMMMRELSEKLGVQFIVVTHNKDLIDAADRVIEVSQRDGKSRVRYG